MIELIAAVIGLVIFIALMTIMTNTGRTTKLLQELVTLQKAQAKEVNAGRATASVPPPDAGYYVPTRIPADRFYVDTRNVSDALYDAGLVSKAQLATAEGTLEQKGGHVCDHLLALGFVSEPDLRRFFREKYRLTC